MVYKINLHFVNHRLLFIFIMITLHEASLVTLEISENLLIFINKFKYLFFIIFDRFLNCSLKIVNTVHKPNQLWMFCQFKC